MKKNCDLCKGKFDEGPADSIVEIRLPNGKARQWKVDQTCAATVEEFILEFIDDVKSGFKNQDDAWKLDRPLYLQKKLEVNTF